jgi:hypothetical protein
MKKITSLVLGVGFLLGMTAFAQDASTPSTDSSTKTTTKHKKKHKKDGTTETTDQTTTKKSQQ